MPQIDDGGIVSLRGRTYFVFFVVLSLVAGCDGGGIDPIKRLETMTGDEFLGMPEEERTAFVRKAVSQFKRTRLLHPSFMCDELLNEDALGDLFDRAAVSAKDGDLAFQLSAISAQDCAELN